MESAIARFQRILDENNLTAQLTRPVIRYIENGGMIIDQAQLSVSFTDPTKEVTDEPVQPATGKPSAKAVEQKA